MMKTLNKGPDPTDSQKQKDTVVPDYAAKLDMEIISGLRNKRFKLGGNKIIRLTEEFKDEKLKETLNVDTQKGFSQIKNTECEVNNSTKRKESTQKSIPQGIPNKAEFMRRGKMFVKALEDDAIKIKGRFHEDF